MALEIRIKPVESLLFRSDIVAAGRFRCHAAHPLFRDSGPCSHHTFVFPRTATRICHRGSPEFVATPGSVAFYNQYQLYTRAKVSDVDASDWFTIADDLLLEVMSEHDRTATLQRPFRIAANAGDPRSFLEQRMLFDALDRGAELDPLQVEETVLRLLRRVVRRAYGVGPALQPAPDRLRGGPAQAIEHVRQLIASNPAANVSLRALATACGLSPFQLCRLFRARTGETLTRHRHALRLSLALERLRDPAVDLTHLALELGYSSHSHFTFAFRRHFGITPSRYRARP